MSGINTGKVITGGLVAGLVYAAIDFINNTLLLGSEFAANATRLGLDPAAAESSTALVLFVAVDLLLGILTVFIYAAIRPRFGPGPKTAVIAGLIPYLSVILVMLLVTATGVFTGSIFVKMAIIQLVNSILGAIAGAALYKE